MSSFEEELEQNGTLVFPNKGTSMMPLLRQNRDLMVIEKRGPERLRPASFSTARLSACARWGLAR